MVPDAYSNNLETSNRAGEQGAPACVLQSAAACGPSSSLLLLSTGAGWRPCIPPSAPSLLELTSPGQGWPPCIPASAPSLLELTSTRIKLPLDESDMGASGTGLGSLSGVGQGASVQDWARPVVRLGPLSGL